MNDDISVEQMWGNCPVGMDIKYVFHWLLEILRVIREDTTMKSFVIKKTRIGTIYTRIPLSCFQIFRNFKHSPTLEILMDNKIWDFTFSMNLNIQVD